MIQSIKFDRNEHDASTRVGFTFQISDAFLAQSNKHIMDNFNRDLNHFITCYFANIEHNTQIREDVINRENRRANEFNFKESL